MLDDLAAEHIRTETERNYSDRLSGNLLNGTAKRERRLVTNTDELSKFFVGAAKISGLASLAVGGILLIVYLHSEGAPVPAADSSISVLLSLVSVAFFFIMLIMLSLVLLPIYQRATNKGNEKKVYLSIARARNEEPALLHMGVAVLRYFQDFGIS